jgi:hypothetical protein
MGYTEDWLTGKRFGRLLVKSRNGTKIKPCGKKYATWDCLCDCGNTTVVSTTGLTSGRTQSCSCYQKERTSAAATKHSASKTSTYKSYNQMRQRCLNLVCPHYHKYGGAGITICTRWQESFENFLEDMGERPEGTSLNRIHGAPVYSKETCEWSSISIQSYDQKLRSDNTSGVAGVGYSKTQAKWSAYIHVDKKPKFLGYFISKEDAIEKRRSAELQYFGFYKDENLGNSSLSVPVQQESKED